MCLRCVINENNETQMSRDTWQNWVRALRRKANRYPRIGCYINLVLSQQLSKFLKTTKPSSALAARSTCHVVGRRCQSTLLTIRRVKLSSPSPHDCKAILKVPTQSFSEALTRESTHRDPTPHRVSRVRGGRISLGVETTSPWKDFFLRPVAHHES